MFKKKAKLVSILDEKRAKLFDLKAQANCAVNIVSSTISNLELINQEIDDTVTEIDEYTKQLVETREALDKDRRYNTAIIANFSKLLVVDDEPTEKEADV